MIRMTLLLDSVEKAEKFVDTVSGYDADMDLSAGRYAVDAKSILGVLSLGRFGPMTLTIYDDDEKIREVLKEFTA